MKALIIVGSLSVSILILFAVMLYLIINIDPQKIYYDYSEMRTASTSPPLRVTARQHHVDSVVDLLSRQGLINLDQRSILKEDDMNSRSSNLMKKHNSDLKTYDFVIDLMDLRGFHRLNVSLHVNNMGMVLDTDIEDKNSLISKYWVGDIVKFIVEENSNETSEIY